MKKVVFVSIDMPDRWSQWHSGKTDDVYYSDFFDTIDDANVFLEKVKKDYPDNNLLDNKCDHDYYIQYVVLDYDENDKKGFETLINMMRAYYSYNKKHN